MELGMIGLGRMGANMTERLVLGGHRVVSYDRSPEAIQHVVDKGALGAHSLADFIKQLSPPRAIWLMVPSGDPVDQTIEQLRPNLAKGDVIIDGVNEVKALLLELLGAANGIFVVGVTAVDDDIALRQRRQQLIDGLIDRIARRHHQPNGARQRQLFDEIGERLRSHCAFVDDPPDRFVAAVVSDYAVAAEHQPFGHVGAHPAKPDHS